MGIFFKIIGRYDVTSATPMNSFSKHIHLKTGIQIIATSSEQVSFWKTDPDKRQTLRHNVEDEMMAMRLHIFNLPNQKSSEELIKDIPKCKKCFAQIIFSDS